MMEWIKSPSGKTRAQLVEELTHEALVYKDLKDHIWVVMMNNRGSSLLCFGIGEVDGVWHHKLITEATGPDVFDCPLEFLDMTVPRNKLWRDQVVAFHSRE